MSTHGQAPGIPVYKQGRHESEYEDKIGVVARQFFATNAGLNLERTREQLRNRKTCALDLPRVNTARLTPRQICEAGRRSHVRVGWAFFCTHCDDWHVNLAGGYALTADGAVATCYHVVRPGREVKAGCLIAADENAKVFPVLEVLAANRYSDACIVRIAAEGLSPLPLSTNVYPGDAAFCYSDPLDHRGYFTHGLVNRFYEFPGRRPFSAPPSAAFAPTRLNVSTDWAPGSSGSAVLDECANAIGHVSTIETVGDEEFSAEGELQPGPTMIVFHEAVSAKDVLKLIEPRKK